MTKPVYEKHYNESASKIGQYVHNRLKRKFDGIDIDYVVWKASRRCLRFFEEKLPGEQLKPSQCRLLPVLARLVQLGINDGSLSRDSGVWVLHWWQAHDAPSEDENGNLCATFKVQRITECTIGSLEDILPREVRTLISGDPVVDAVEATDGTHMA